MKTYILDTVERVKRYSQSLDVKTILSSKAWYVLNEDGDTENLIFQPDGSVLVSVNGSTRKYTWQYIPQNQSLNIMHSEAEGTMLKPAFIDGTILAFNKIGTKECMFLIDDSLDESKKIYSLESVKKYLLAVEGEAIKKAKAIEDKKKSDELAKIAKAIEDKKRIKAQKLEEERIIKEKIKELELEIFNAPNKLNEYKNKVSNIEKSDWGVFIFAAAACEPDYNSKVDKATVVTFTLGAIVFICNIILIGTEIFPFLNLESIGLTILQIFYPLILAAIVKLAFFLDYETYRYYQFKKLYKQFVPVETRSSKKFNDELLNDTILPLLRTYRSCLGFINNYSTYISKLNRELQKLKQ